VDRMLLAGLASSVFAFLYGPPYRLEQFDLPKELALAILGVGCCVYLLLQTGSHEASRFRLLFAGTLLWAAVLAPVVAASTVASWRTLGAAAAAGAVFVVARERGRDRQAPAGYWALLLFLGLMAILVLLEAYGGLPFFSAPGRRPGATLGNRNLAARVACFGLLVTWDRLLETKPRWLHVSLTVLAALFVCVVTVSRTRGAMAVSAGLFVALPALTWWFHSGTPGDVRRAATRAWVLAFVVGAGAALRLPNQMGWTASDVGASVRRIGEYHSGTGRGRVLQAKTSLAMIRAHPLFGVGVGNWSVVYPAYAEAGDPSVAPGAYYPGPQIPRNDILALTAELGLPGSMGVFGGLVALLLEGVRRRSACDMRVRASGVLIVGSVCTTVLLGVFDSVLRVAPTLLVCAVLLGFALGEVSPHQGPMSIAWQPNRRWVWRALWGGCLGLSLLCALRITQEIRALRIIGSLLSLGDLKRAVSAAPYNMEARALTAYLLTRAGRCDLGNL
jgi:O-antigen ligase